MTNSIQNHKILEGFDLNRQQQLQAAASLIGYHTLPPTIDEFLDNPYYLGNVVSVYPYWKDKLRQVFPDEIHTSYTYLVLTGAIGTGKSTFSKIVALYNECRLNHLSDLTFFGISLTKAVDFNWFHVSKGKAYDDFINSIGFMKSHSPYFQNLINIKIPIRHKPDGTRGNSGIGGDVIFYNFSELNFVKPHIAKFKLETGIKRFRSRFQKAMPYLGNIIIDTSSAGDSSIAEEFVANNPYAPLVIRTSIWDAKGHLGIYFQNDNGFEVYSGDQIIEPYIVTESNPLRPGLDTDRIVRCPSELRDDFEFDITRALQDHAGISTGTTGRLFKTPDKLKASLSIPNLNHDVITVDFYDMSDKLMDYVYDSVNTIPKDKIVYLRYDIGVTGDLTGIAVTYFDEMINPMGNKKILYPKWVTPVAFGVSRPSEQETSIQHLQEFAMDLNDMRQVGCCTLDQYGSRQLMQNLNRSGIYTRLLSVDRTDASYTYLKSCINNGTWRGVKNQRLFIELKNLNHINGKVDHPSTGSKDIADAVAGSVYNANQYLDQARQISNTYLLESQIKILRESSKISSPAQQMLNNLW